MESFAILPAALHFILGVRNKVHWFTQPAVFYCKLPCLDGVGSVYVKSSLVSFCPGTAVL